MSHTVIASSMIAAVVLGFSAQNQAMLVAGLTAGMERTVKPVFDAMVAIISGFVVVFALALGLLMALPQGASTAAMGLASLVLALSGLARYLTEPRAPVPGHPETDQTRHVPDIAVTGLALKHFHGVESWAVAFFLAGSALSGTLSLATAFVALVTMTAIGLSIWAMAGWSGCSELTSGWHRRHLDWGFGILIFVAAMASLVPEG